MPSTLPETPFSDQALEEVHLPQAPLVKVISQVRFPMLMAITQESSVADFQRLLRTEYPILRQEHEAGIVLSSEGVKPLKEGGTLWRLTSRDGAWQVTLAPTFLALDTTAYDSRNDFLERLRRALSALQEVVRPVLYDRLGLRYVDRLAAPADLTELGRLVRRELLGVLSTSLPSEVRVNHSLSDSLFVLADARLQARWGLLPPNTSLDPSIEPAREASWVLDLDVFDMETRDFETEVIVERARAFAGIHYRFFRWAVTEELLRQSGGQL